jgi:hypothetical protein
MMTRNELIAAMARVHVSRDRGVQWLLKHVADDGEPAGARERNGWARVPWALALSGQCAVAAAVVEWAERTALAPEGGFKPGPALGAGRFLAYPMAHLAIGAWLLERYGVALSLMAGLRRLQDPVTGGLPIAAPVGAAKPPRCDLLSTAQTGIAALLTRQDDVAEGVHRWITELHAQQPALPQRLYSFRDGDTLLTVPEKELVWLAITEFDQPRQSYYTAGIAAAFLAGWAMQHDDAEALALGHAFLQLNRSGTAQQFEDTASVQICKFGWGVAAMTAADPQVDQAADLVRMGDWFTARQGEDGAWSMSSFLMAESGVIEKMAKTAEHVMELNAILSALGTVLARQQ